MSADIDIVALRTIAEKAKTDNAWPFNINVFRNNFTPEVTLALFDRLDRAESAVQSAPQVPVAWIDQFGNVFPLSAYSVDGKPNYHDQHKRGWKPLFTAASPQPVERTLTDEDIDIILERLGKEDKLRITYGQGRIIARAIIAASKGQP